MHPKSEVHNVDCLEYMRGLPDKHFDLVIADPPYGINADKSQKQRAGKQMGKALAKSKDYGSTIWDMAAPTKLFFDEILRIGKNCVVWGANHFISRMPYDSPCWIVWDKENGNNTYADCELAWTTFEMAVRKFRYKWHGMLQENMQNKETRIHPTQKPIALYAWLLSTYGGGCKTIFDPMMGSQSSRIAAWKLGFDYVGCELDKEYFEKGCARFDRECKGEIKATDGRIIKQLNLFE